MVMIKNAPQITRWATSYALNVIPRPAGLLQLYFSSFEAGIAYAISSFK